MQNSSYHFTQLEGMTLNGEVRNGTRQHLQWIALRFKPRHRQLLLLGCGILFLQHPDAEVIVNDAHRIHYKSFSRRYVARLQGENVITQFGEEESVALHEFDIIDGRDDL